jgi:gluconolactonase
MRKLLLGTVLSIAGGWVFVSAQRSAPPPTERPFKIVRMDPGLDAIVSTDAKLEVLGDRYGLTEAPLWVQEGANGHLLFSDLIANVIYKRTPDGKLSVFLERAGYSGNDINNVGQQTRRGRMAVILTGPNGLTMDAQGRVIFCAMADRTVVRLEKDGTRTVLADRYEGKRFGGPNDVVLRSDGALYFTDSVNGLRGGGRSPERELDFSGVYLAKDGKVTLLASDKDLPGGFPNGITFSPDEKHLYLNFGFLKIVRYDVRPDGTIENPQLFIDREGTDGMKTDRQGNVYTTSGAGPGEVRITSPQGKRLGVIQLPVVLEEPQDQICATNVSFGDRDSKGLYITACTHVYRIQLKTAGLRPGPQ